MTKELPDLRVSLLGVDLLVEDEDFGEGVLQVVQFVVEEDLLQSLLVFSC